MNYKDIQKRFVFVSRRLSTLTLRFDFVKLVERMGLLSSIKRADIALPLMPVAGGDAEGTCCMTETAGPLIRA